MVLEEDDGLKRLDYTEAFHRAKRNTLWWSVITILILVGTTHQHETVTITTPVGGLSYFRNALVIGSGFAWLATVISYLRAWSRLPAEDALLKRLRILDESATSIENQAREALEGLTRVTRLSEAHLNEVESFRAESDIDDETRLHHWNDMIAAVTSFESAKSRLQAPNEVDIPLGIKRERAMDAAREHEFAGDHLRGIEAAITKRLSETIRTKFLNILERQAKEESQALGVISKLKSLEIAGADVVSELRKISKDYRFKERAAHFVDNHLPVLFAWIVLIGTAASPDLQAWAAGPPPSVHETKISCPQGCAITIPPPLRGD